jgi:hypothetical protein
MGDDGYELVRVTERTVVDLKTRGFLREIHAFIL